MDLMIVKDIMQGKDGQMIITGPLLLKDFSLRSEVENAFGSNVFVSGANSEKFSVAVLGISVSQGMSGNWQVSAAIDYSASKGEIAHDCIVSDEF
jgi:hypothetical protein